MFVIFGWNHQEIISFGPVKAYHCENCNNFEFWHLKKISYNVTLFFFPIFPHDSDSLLCCPICNYGIKLDKVEFQNYKSIAEINLAFQQEKITEEDRIKKIESINKIIDKIEEEKIEQIKEESKKYRELAMGKTDSELKIITIEKRSEFKPAFIMAAEFEIEKRNSKNEQ